MCYIKPMELADVFNDQFFVAGLTARNKKDAIGRLLDGVYQMHPFTESKQSLFDRIMKREREGGTVFKSGIALPHIRLPELESLVVGVAIPAAPLRVKGINVRLMVLMIASDQAPGPYLNVLSTLVKLSRDDEVFGRLISSETREQFAAALAGASTPVERQRTVRDIMLTPPITVTAGKTVKELIDILYDSKWNYALVVDQESNLLGEVEVLDLIRLGIPDYAQQMGSLRFVRSFEPFDELLRREDKIKVQDVMHSLEISLDVDDSIVEAALRLERSKRSSLPVLHRGRIVGVVRDSDILTKVLRGAT